MVQQNEKEEVRQPELTIVQAVNILGVTVQVETASENIAHWFAFDFRTFLSEPVPEHAQITLTAAIGSADQMSIPPLQESMRGPHFVCFDDKLTRYIKYPAKALVVYDFAQDQGHITAVDEEAAYERLYLTCLSRVGEKLDCQGLHRVHALAIACDNRAHLFLMPPKTGKSSLALGLLGKPGIKLISDDTPLINHRGEVIPFLFRVGVTDLDLASDIPAQFKRSASAAGLESKTIVDVSFWNDRLITARLRPKTIFVGFWTSADTPHYVAASKLTAFVFLVRDCVIGFGIPQVAELFLRSQLTDILKKMRIALSRFWAAAIIALQCRCYKIYLCRDHEKNANMVASILP